MIYIDEVGLLFVPYPAFHTLILVVNAYVSVQRNICHAVTELCTIHWDEINYIVSQGICMLSTFHYNFYGLYIHKIGNCGCCNRVYLIFLKWVLNN